MNEVYLLCKQCAASSTDTSYGHFNLRREKDTDDDDADEL